MSELKCVLGALLIAVMLIDAGETVLLPRTVGRQIRLTRIVYRLTWAPVRSLASRLKGEPRDYLLGSFGPAFLIFLLVIWAAGLILGFGLVQDGLGPEHLVVQNGPHDFGAALYLSATTFFTLGLGDVGPGTTAMRVAVVIEAGTGFAFLALVIGYLPIYYSAFSRREVYVSILDERAGSPPTAFEMVRRNGPGETQRFLSQWETWSSELLESHVSYPVLASFRSQHDGQSWLAALTMILDTCALVMSGIQGFPKEQARFTFAIGRHALVDLCQIFYAEPMVATPLRLSKDDFKQIQAGFEAAGFGFDDAEEAWQRLGELRTSYEPFAFALGERLLIDLPPWLPASDHMDDWQTSPWDSIPDMEGWRS